MPRRVGSASAAKVVSSRCSTIRLNLARRRFLVNRSVEFNSAPFLWLVDFKWRKWSSSGDIALFPAASAGAISGGESERWSAIDEVKADFGDVGKWFSTRTVSSAPPVRRVARVT